MDALVGRDRSQTARQMLTAPGERRIVGGGEVEAHHPEQGVQEPFGLAQREMVEEPQGQGGLDGEIRVPPLPAPPAAPAGCPGRDRLRGHPHRHIAASNKGLIVGRPVRNAVLRLIRGMDLRLHPCSVAPAEGHEKCGPRRPTPTGYSCNNVGRRQGVLARRGGADAPGLDTTPARLPLADTLEALRTRRRHAQIAARHALDGARPASKRWTR